MRLPPTIIGLLAMVCTPASAAPNVFWTFGFDLPRASGRAPHFGEAGKDLRYAANDGQKQAASALPTVPTSIDVYDDHLPFARSAAPISAMSTFSLVR